MEFYNNYIRLCNQVNKTPSRVAQENGFSKSAVCRWKKGGGITDSAAARLADYFSVSVDYLLRDEAEPITNVHDSTVIHGSVGDNNLMNSSAVQPGTLSDLESEVIRILRSCGMRTKNNILTYLYNIEDGKR